MNSSIALATREFSLKTLIVYIYPAYSYANKTRQTNLMYRKTLDFLFQALAVKQYLIFSGMFFVLTAFVMFILDAQIRPSGCADMISLELVFTKSGLNQILLDCGAKGVRSHLIMLWVDYIFIVSYVGFLANLLGSLLKNIEYERALTLFSIPIIAGVLDVIENTIFLFQLQNLDSLNGGLIFLASSAALVKFVLIGITIILIFYYLFKKKPETA